MCKLTILAWDPPGYGKSRPPNRTFPLDFFARDAKVALKFMKSLGHDKFSIVGWSGNNLNFQFEIGSEKTSTFKFHRWWDHRPLYGCYVSCLMFKY